MTQEETNIRTRYTRPYISNAVFYIPFSYYYVVRLGTVPKLLSWMMIYWMPTAFYSAIGYTGSWGLFVLNYFLILFATFSLYECGYIYNDTIAIHHEEQPAIRLYAHNFDHFARRHSLILGCRLSYSIAALTALYILNGFTAWRVAAAVGVMCLCFAIYNRCRGRNNVWLYPLLVCSRYIPFMLLYEQTGLTYLLLFLSFPLLNALERFSMPRYRWPFMRRLIPNEPAKTHFRVAYYALVLIIGCPIHYAIQQPLWLLSPILILGIYRCGLALLVRKHSLTNYLNG